MANDSLIVANVDVTAFQWVGDDMQVTHGMIIIQSELARLLASIRQRQNQSSHRQPMRIRRTIHRVVAEFASVAANSDKSSLHTVKDSRVSDGKPVDI